MKKGVLKIFGNFKGKHLCWNLFLIKLQVTTASRKINICLIIKVLLLCRIKLSNSNVDKKKKACAKIGRQKSSVTRIVEDRRYFNISTMWI